MLMVFFNSHSKNINKLVLNWDIKALDKKKLILSSFKFNLKRKKQGTSIFSSLNSWFSNFKRTS